MAYIPPFVDATGLHISSFLDTLTYLQDAYKRIYGSDVVLDDSTQDGQLIAIFAKAIFDSAIALQAVYNQFSPTTAVGTGLSSVVQINGISRIPATASTADVILTGSPSTQILNGIVQDTIFNNNWALPASVVLNVFGTATVTATCLTLGAISVGANTITKIVTPTLGWTSITNPANSTIGNDIETDAQLRVRQVFSTALPSQSIIDGMYGALLSLPGVSQVAIYENPTNVIITTTNPDRNPNSVAVVIIGGNNNAIAQTIFNRKTIGTNSQGFITGTPGSITINVSGTGISNVPITFYRPVNIVISVLIVVRQLTGWVLSTAQLIQIAIANYITQNINIGQPVLNSRVITAGYNTPLSTTYDITSVTLSAPGKTPDTLGNILINDNEEASCLATNVTVQVTT